MIKIPICCVCGEDIDTKKTLRRIYCSDECHKIGHTAKSKQFHDEIRALNMKLHRCTYCGQDNLDSLKYRLCLKCREKQREYCKKRNEKIKAMKIIDRYIKERKDLFPEEE